jgi:two-component system NtrC family sensor kinase
VWGHIGTVTALLNRQGFGSVPQ